MAEATDGELADVVGIAGDPCAPVENPGRAVDAPDIGQAHLFPVALGTAAMASSSDRERL